jgi:glycosyltransferase involved in cell wall biosynthesis
MERDLIQRVDSVVAVSQVLVDRLSRLGVQASLLTHGIDLQHWQKPGELAFALEDFPRPLVGFWGVVDRRLNTKWLEALSQELAEGSILLIGPENNPDPSLDQLPNVFRVGSVGYDQLPAIAKELSVLIMPYDDLPVTRSMQPLKLKEYLATGKPLVTSDLPAVTEWRDACNVADSAEQFSELVVSSLESGIDRQQQLARERLATESWEMKSREFRKTLLGN